MNLLFSVEYMNKALNNIISLMMLLTSGLMMGQTVDFSVVSVGEESGLDFTRITQDGDGVCLPQVKRTSKGVNWYTNRIIDVTPDGQNIAYLSNRNGTTNIFIKELAKMGASRMRTNRQAVVDFSYSPDGKQICFSESKGKTNQLFVTDAASGFVCRQITNGALDYSPIYDNDMQNIFFTRMENTGASIWAYNITNNYLSSYVAGMNPDPSADGNTIYVARTVDGKGEIWRINIANGIEECILSHPQISFYSPSLSPDGQTLLLCGGNKIESGNIVYWNTDIFTCHKDGSDLRQLTYHAADDLSPAWGAKGDRIFFISQRGSADGVANVWMIPYLK